MRFYTASRLENAPEVKALNELLTSYGHELTYDWTAHGAVYRKDDSREANEAVMGTTANNELIGVLLAHVVIVLLPGGRGTHVELGAALALRKKVIVAAPHDNWDDSFYPCAFHYHDLAHRIIEEDPTKRLAMILNEATLLTRAI